MKLTYDHVLVASFMSWFDFTLVNNGGAFFNASSLLYPTKSDYYSNQYLYSAPYRPWAYDTGVSGVSVPTGVYDANGNFLTRDSGIYISFDKGVIGSNSPLAAPLSGSYTVREFDVFYTNEDEDTFISQTKFEHKPQTSMQIPSTGLPYSTRTFPCCAVKYNAGDNKDFMFGGTQNTVSQFRVLVVADSSFQIDGVLSIFRDSRLSNFTLLGPSQLPFNSVGDYKGGVPFNYLNNISTNPENFIWISDVDCLKLSDAAATRVGQKLYTAMIDFTVERPRNVKLTFSPLSGYADFRVTEDGYIRITE